MEHLKAWRDEDKKSGCEYLINYHGSPVNSIKRGWGEAKRRAGISRRIRLYDLRHKFATDLLTNIGVDVKTVSRLLGHSSPVTTVQVYQHVTDQHGRDAVDRLPDLGNTLTYQNQPETKE